LGAQLLAGAFCARRRVVCVPRSLSPPYLGIGGRSCLPCVGMAVVTRHIPGCGPLLGGGLPSPPSRGGVFNGLHRRAAVIITADATNTRPSHRCCPRPLQAPSPPVAESHTLPYPGCRDAHADALLPRRVHFFGARSPRLWQLLGSLLALCLYAALAPRCRPFCVTVPASPRTVASCRRAAVAPLSFHGFILPVEVSRRHLPWCLYAALTPRCVVCFFFRACFPPYRGVVPPCRSCIPVARRQHPPRGSVASPLPSIGGGIALQPPPPR